MKIFLLGTLSQSYKGRAEVRVPPPSRCPHPSARTPIKPTGTRGTREKESHPKLTGPFLYPTFAITLIIYLFDRIDDSEEIHHCPHVELRTRGGWTLTFNQDFYLISWTYGQAATKTTEFSAASQQTFAHQIVAGLHGESLPHPLYGFVLPHAMR